MKKLTIKEFFETIGRKNQKCSWRHIENNILHTINWDYLSKEKFLSEPFIEKFQDKFYWDSISKNQKLSEEFIEIHQDQIDWFRISMFQKLSEPFIEKFYNRVFWDEICEKQTLSEPFMEKFAHKIWWHLIASSQTLSEDFIEKHQDKIDWSCISEYQILSESFIEKHEHDVNWHYICVFQKLSEKFIEKEKFKYKVDWQAIAYYQEISEEFFQKHKYHLALYCKKHIPKSYEEKLEEVKLYAKEYNLTYDDKYLYAFRNHDKFGRGVYQKSRFYEKGKYYRDWHCDLNKQNTNSFGLGIWPEGNTPIKVKIEDWGTEVKDDRNGKARVWGFEVI